jgi:hypothetical protein
MLAETVTATAIFVRIAHGSCCRCTTSLLLSSWWWLSLARIRVWTWSDSFSFSLSLFLSLLFFLSLFHPIPLFSYLLFQPVSLAAWRLCCCVSLPPFLPPFLAIPLRQTSRKPSLANMGSNSNLEKDLDSGRDQEDGTTRCGSPCQSDNEKAEHNTVGACGTPDLEHDEVEQMDAGHLDDLARQHVRLTYI